MTTWIRPDELEDFIEKTWRELPELGLMRLVLEVAHEKSKEHDLNFPDPGMLVGDPRLVRRRTTKEQIKHILEAVAVTTGMVVIRNTTTYEFAVITPVETILDAMTTVSQELAPGDKARPK